MNLWAWIEADDTVVRATLPNETFPSPLVTADEHEARVKFGQLVKTREDWGHPKARLLVFESVLEVTE